MIQILPLWKHTSSYIELKNTEMGTMKYTEYNTEYTIHNRNIIHEQDDDVTFT